MPMTLVKWVQIATKAYQQAVKYESVSKEQREQLFHFIHDWFRMIEDENEALQNGEETPNQFTARLFKELNETSSPSS
jgi:hypothetical protein